MSSDRKHAQPLMQWHDCGRTCWGCCCYCCVSAYLYSACVCAREMIPLVTAGLQPATIKATSLDRSSQAQTLFLWMFACSGAAAI